MWDYFDKSELILSTDFSYFIVVWEEDDCILKKKLDFNIEQAEIEFKKTLNEYRDSASRIVLYICVSSMCLTKEDAQLAVKDLKKIYRDYTFFEIPKAPSKLFDYYPIVMFRDLRSYFHELNMEFFAPDYWGLDKPNK